MEKFKNAKELLLNYLKNAEDADKVVELVLQQQNKKVPAIDHIGINVPDIDSASIFLQQAFDAEVLYESYTKKQSPLEFDGNEAALNLSPQTKLYACRMIKIGNGPDIELFEVHVNGQREAVKSSDLGIQHLAIYTDHWTASIEKFSKAGGKVLSEPNRLLFPLEAGDTNFFCYGVTPWGTSVEFITYPDGMPYETQTTLRRFKGGN
jgi:catechol 2,3-dioxygenase-like lactoylglutathione lyase family enzyme